MQVTNTQKSSASLVCGFFTGFMHYCKIYNLRKENDEDNKIIQKLYPQIKSLAVLKEKIKTANRGE